MLSVYHFATIRTPGSPTVKVYPVLLSHAVYRQPLKFYAGPRTGAAASRAS